MIFIDSNVPMYLVGSDHPNKLTSRRVLERFALDREMLVTDAEVFQEILHRYTFINRREAITPTFEILFAIVDEVFPITREIIIKSKDLLTSVAALSARDAVHASVMKHFDITRIFTFDRDFENLAGIKIES
jgi:predicted nucleic acid-binding protein